jgi:hypothetical protein
MMMILKHVKALCEAFRGVLRLGYVSVGNKSKPKGGMIVMIVVMKAV